MSLASKIGQTLTNVGSRAVNAGAKAAKVIAKNPKATMAAGGAAVIGYVLGHKDGVNEQEANDKSKTSNRFLKMALALGLGGVIGAKIAKNPKVQEFLGKVFKKGKNAAEKGEKVAEKVKEIIKDKIKTTKPKSVNVGVFDDAVKNAGKVSEKVAQTVPQGEAKSSFDFIMKNFESHIRSLNEDRAVFKGTSEEFTKRLQQMYKEFKGNYPQYSDYISKNLDDFMAKY